MKLTLKMILMMIGLLLFLNTFIMLLIANFNSGIFIAFGVSLVLLFMACYMKSLIKLNGLNISFMADLL